VSATHSRPDCFSAVYTIFPSPWPSFAPPGAPSVLRLHDNVGLNILVAFSVPFKPKLQIFPRHSTHPQGSSGGPFPPVQFHAFSSNLSLAFSICCHVNTLFFFPALCPSQTLLRSASDFSVFRAMGISFPPPLRSVPYPQLGYLPSV